VLGSTTDVPALRAQLETLAAAGEHAQVIATLFELLEKIMRDHSDLAARYTSMLRGMYRSKSERISPDQLALFLAQLPANETTKPPRRARAPAGARAPAQPGRGRRRCAASRSQAGQAQAWRPQARAAIDAARGREGPGPRR